MKVETLIYAYIAICISLILFNCVYVFIIRYHEKRISKETGDYDASVAEQLNRLEEGLPVSDSHKKRLCRRLKKINNLTAFDRSIETFFQKDPEKTKQYLFEIYSVFICLSAKYRGRDTIKTAYFPYIISKYDILTYEQGSVIVDALFDLLRSEDVYCRENALKAIYSTGRCDYAVKALRAIDKNPGFHHPKLVCDGLLGFAGDKNELSKLLWESFRAFSVAMQVNILNFLRFAGIRCDENMYGILTDEQANQELRFSAIRYFEKFCVEGARAVLQDIAENQQGRAWEYQAIASSALKSYPDERTAEILTNNLSHINWYVRLNSAISCEALDLSYTDLAKVFDGEDRYAREMLWYRLERREAEQEGAKV